MSSNPRAPRADHDNETNPHPALREARGDMGDSMQQLPIPADTFENRSGAIFLLSPMVLLAINSFRCTPDERWFQGYDMERKGFGGGGSVPKDLLTGREADLAVSDAQIIAGAMRVYVTTPSGSKAVLDGTYAITNIGHGWGPLSIMLKHDDGRRVEITYRVDCGTDDHVIYDVEAVINNVLEGAKV